MPTKQTISVRVNGTVRTKEMEARTLLTHFLREDLYLTGTHIGCDTSQCGACTVIVDGQAVKSCTMLAVQADGSDVITVEGIGNVEHLHPMQKGFWEKHGLQCGFCTPGMMITMIALLQENPQPTEEEIREGMEGVICRCTGYQFIVEAVQHAAQLMKAEDVSKVAAAVDPLQEGGRSYE